MNTIALAGGSGHVGRAVIPDLVSLGVTPRILSRRGRPENLPPGVQWGRVDYKSGTGLSDSLTGVDAIMFTVGGMKETAVVRAVVQESAPRVPLIYLSIVGIDSLPMSYYRAKLESEAVIKRSGNPWTILRATQFHSLVWGMLSGLVKIPGIMLVPRMRMQSVAVSDVARRFAQLSQDEPLGYAPEIGGPEIFDMEAAARQYLRARGKRRCIKIFSVPGKLKQGLQDGANLTPKHADGTQTFADYVAGKMAA